MAEITRVHSKAAQSRDKEAPDYIERTRAFWQSRYARELTREDARQMAHNLVGFFRLLREWEIEERRAALNAGRNPIPAQAKSTKEKKND